MTTTATPIEEIPPLSRAEAAELASRENERFVALVRSLSAEDWGRPTDCPAWDVQGIACHILGSMEANASFPTFVRQLRAGKKAAGQRPQIDGMTEVQVRERAHLTPTELTERLSAMAPMAARGRRRVPGPLRRVPMRVEVDGRMEPWRVGYLMDTIYTRDTWMHRVDIARATGRPLELTASHDGRIVADVVAEWARRHGEPVALELTGPAGGTWRRGDGEEIRLDAVEFCRTLSGRTAVRGLLAQVVPF